MKDINLIIYKNFLIILYILFCSFALVFYVFDSYKKHNISDIVENHNKNIEESYYKNIDKNLKNRAYIAANDILNQDEVIEFVAKKDKGKLEEIIKNYFEHQKQNDRNIKQINFYLPNNELFFNYPLSSLNEHNQDNNFLVSQSIALQKNLDGFERSQSDILYYSVVPIISKELGYVGTIEVGVSLEVLMSVIANFNELKGVLYLDNEKIMHSKELDLELIKHIEEIENKQSPIDIKYNEQYLSVYIFPIHSIKKEYLGEFVFIQDLTAYYIKNNYFVQQVFLINIGILILTYVSIIYIFVSFSKKTLKQKHRIEKIIDAQNSILGIINIQQERLLQVNKAFCTFFGVKDIDEFLKNNGSPCSYFIEEEGYLSSIVGEFTWVEYILKYPQKTHLAQIQRNEKLYTFKVFVNSLEDKNEAVFSFEDVSLEIEKERLLKKNIIYTKALLDNNAVAIFLASPQRIIIEANKRACELFGYSQEEMIESNFELIHISKESYEQFAPEYKIFENSKISNFEYPFKRKNGEVIWCSIFGAPLVFNDISAGIIWSLVDITEKKSIERELLKERNLFHRGPIIIFDVPFMNDYFKGDFRANYISPNCYDILGYTVDELSFGENSLPFIIHKDDAKEYFKKDHFILENGIYFSERSYRMRLRNGEYKWFYSFEQFLRDDDGKLTNIRGCLVDQTELKRAEKMLKLANEELILQIHKTQEASKAKSQFLANMSHEIRTPMNAIIGLGELMYETKLDETQLEYLTKINFSSKLLLRIINDILDFSKIEAGKLEIKEEMFALDEILTELKVIFMELFAKSNVELFLEKSQNLPNIVKADKLRILQVLINFVSNSLKFTNEGKVICKIELKEKLDDEKVKIEFSVSDTGMGMNEEDLSMLFQPFTQIDNSNTRKHEGTGLGLTISDRIIKALDSRIEVKSELKVGSVFSFILELEVVSWKGQKITFAKKNIDNISLEHISSLRGLKVLLVEDNEVNQDVATTILNRVEIEVVVANNGEEGVEKYKNNIGEYDLILMDLQMPVLNGYEAAKRIREFDTKIPIIALSAAITSKDRQKILKIGMNDYLVKPINKDKLYSYILKYCKNQKIILNNNIKKEYKKVIIDYEYLDDSLHSKNLINKILIKFNNSLNKEFANIIKEIEQNDKNASVGVHTLKGSSGNIGARILFDICNKIDSLYKKQMSIPIDEIESLKKAITDVKNELSNIQESNEICNKIDSADIKQITNFIKDVKQKLKRGNIINEETLEKLLCYLCVIVSIENLEILRNDIEEFEYDKAIEFLDKLIIQDN